MIPSSFRLLLFNCWWVTKSIDTNEVRRLFGANLSFLEYRWQCHEDFVKYALEYYNINMGNKTRIFMYYLPQGITLLKLSRVLKCRPEELLAYVDCLWKITYWKYVPLIVQCNCYMTDGNSGVYHVKYNKRMPTVWAKSPDVRFFLFLG